MPILLGLAAALTYGAADFLGGISARRAHVLTVLFVSQAAGTVALLASLPLFLSGSPTKATLVWGALSGVAGATGVGLFYKALAVGRMSVVAPLTGVIAASAPVVFGLLSGERPSSVALAGVAVALVAVVLVSAAPEAPSPDRRAPSVQLALGAGLGFGLFFILLAQAGDETSSLWPLVAARGASLPLMGIALLVARRPVSPRPATATIIGAGVLDVLANLFYLAASRRGLLSLVAVLTSMYPATTVVLARVILKERLFRLQLVGLGAAAAGVALIALG